MTSRGIRPSTTRSIALLQLKSLLNGLLFFLIFMVALPYGAHWLHPVVLPLPAWICIGWGAPLVLAGLALWISCLDIFSRQGRGTPFPLDAPRHLVTSGPYHFVRNPIMVGELAVIWGEGFLFASLPVLLYAAAVTAAGHVVVIYIEEPELRERFGDQYEAYCQRVPRWLPWPPKSGQSD